eukprot:31067-Pelagococcus_subviridis.AAC.3
MTWIIDDENTGLSTTCSGSFQPSCASAYAASNLSYSSGVYSPSPSPSPSSIDAGARHLGGDVKRSPLGRASGPASTSPRRRRRVKKFTALRNVATDPSAATATPVLTSPASNRGPPPASSFSFSFVVLCFISAIHSSISRAMNAPSRTGFSDGGGGGGGGGAAGSSPSAAVGAFIALNRYPVSSAQSAFERPSPTTLRRRRVLARGGCAVSTASEAAAAAAAAAAASSSPVFVFVRFFASFASPAPHPCTSADASSIWTSSALNPILVASTGFPHPTHSFPNASPMEHRRTSTTPSGMSDGRNSRRR